MALLLLKVVMNYSQKYNWNQTVSLKMSDLPCRELQASEVRSNKHHPCTSQPTLRNLVP